MKKNWYSMVSQIQAHRSDPQPIQYILGGTFFCEEWFIVTPDVLIPRFETEMLVDYVLKVIRNHPPMAGVTRILDLGTGCGNIAIVLAKRLNCKVYAVDISDDALRVARRNAKMHGVEDRVEFYKSDWFTPLEFPTGHKSPCEILTGFSELNIEPVDVIVSNPPYIAEEEWDSLPVEVKDYEPKIALWGGKGGLGHYRKIISGAKDILVPGGRIVMEIGYNQAEAVKGLLEKRGQSPFFINDGFGNPRVVSAIWTN